MIILLFNQGNNRSSHYTASFMTKYSSFFYQWWAFNCQCLTYSARHTQTHVSLFLIVFKVIILQSRQYIHACPRAHIFILIIIVKAHWLRIFSYNELFQAVSIECNLDQKDNVVINFFTLFLIAISFFLLKSEMIEMNWRL